MKKLEKRVERKKEIWKRYQLRLQDIQGINLFQHNLNTTAPWFIDSMVEDRERLIDHLKENNIGSRVMYPPINRQNAYNVKANCPVSDLVGKQGLWLPSSVQLTDDQIDYIGEVIKNFYN